MGFFDNFNNALHGDNNSSPFGEAGLLGDPLHYLIGSKYDDFMRKTWEYPNKYAGQALTKFDTFDRKINPIHRAIDKTEIGGKIKEFVHNKPGDSALAIVGSVLGGGALLGGMGGGGAAGGGGGLVGGGSGGGSGLGVFANGGTGGMAGVGGGNAGTLAAQGGISGGAGMGSATSATPMGMQDYMKMAQSMGGQQQQPQQPAAAPVKGDNSALMAQIHRSARAQYLRKKINRTPQENQELRDLTQSTQASQAGLLA